MRVEGALVVFVLAATVQADTWVWGQPANLGPQPRFEHTATRVRNQLLVLGGTLSNEVREADVHSLNIDTMRWSTVATEGNNPGPVMGHASVLIGDDLYSLFGSNGRSMMNRVHRLDTTTNVWERVVAKGRVPAPRAYHSAVASQGEIFVFGGFDGRFYHNDLHTWKPYDSVTNDTGVWKKVDQTGDIPEVRASAATALYGRKMFLFGGYEVAVYKNDFFMLDLDTSQWTAIKLAKTSSCEMPSARAMASLTLMGTRLVLFGGIYCHSSGNCTELNDVHSYDIYKSTFKSDPPVGLLPPARYGHSGTLIGSKVVVFGGAAWPNLFNDVFQYDLYENSWSLLPGLSPYARKQHSMHTASLGGNSTIDTLVTFGGKHGSGTYSQSLHLFDLETSVWTHPVAEGDVPPPTGHHASIVRDTTLYLVGGFNGTHSNNNVYACDLLSNSWAKLDVDGQIPHALHGHAIVKGSGELYQFGGVDCVEDDCTFFNEVYSLSYETLSWTAVPTRGSGPRPRASHSWTTISPTSHVMFGGIGPYFTNYDDVYIFDEPSKSWRFVPVKGAKPEARYGHVAVGYDGMLVVFGGASCRGVGECSYFNDVHMFIPRTSTWSPVTVQGDAPTPRVGAASAIVGERLFVLGGATHERIFGELITISPDAPVPERSIVYGDGVRGGTVGRNTKLFVQLQDSYGFNRTTGGNVVDATVVPSSRRAISRLLSNRTEVVVSDPFTGQYSVSFNTTVADKYNVTVFVDGTPLPSFLSNIIADVPSYNKSHAKGSGLSKCRVGDECTFSVDLIDAFGNKLARKSPIDVQFVGPKRVIKKVKDVGDGTVRVTYTPEKVGVYTLHVRIRGEPIPLSPWNVAVSHAGASPFKSRVSGDGLSVSEAGKLGKINFVLFDEFENPVVRGGDKVKAELIGADELACSVQDHNNGTYTITYTAIKQGDYNLNIALNDDHILGSPFSVHVTNAPISPATTFAYGSGLRYSISGHRAYFTIQAADDFANNMTSGGAQFNVLYAGAGDSKQLCNVTDHGDGTYTASYSNTVAGDFMLSATLWNAELGYQSIHLSPFMGTTVAAGADPTMSFLYADHKENVIKKESTVLRVVMGVHNYFQLQAVDRYGNLKTSGGDRFTAELEGPVAHDAFISDNGDGTYVGSFIAPAAGHYWLKVFFGNILLKGMPVSVLVRSNFDNCPNACNDHGQCLDDTCVCHAGYAGADCSVETGNCPANCLGNGACINNTCFCYPGFAGPSCEQSTTICPNDCSKHGECRDGLCVCDEGYIGLDCSDNSATCVDGCMGNGECVDGACLCYPGFKGNNCGQKTKFCPKGCSGKGKCGGSGMCSCFAGWTGLDCGNQALDANMFTQQKTGVANSLTPELPARLPRKH